MLGSAALVVVLVSAAVAIDPVRLGVHLLIRDEALLVKTHLPLWLGIAYCSVAGIDERSKDGSHRAYLDATDAAPSLEDTARPRRKDRPLHRRRFAFHFSFDGLGPARTAVLSEASRRFPDATHALFVDPDWRPRVPPSLRSLIAARDRGATVFAFRVTDRNGSTERLLDWCFSVAEGATFKYRWHEALVVPTYEAALLDWDVEEVADADRLSWHAEAHGTSSSEERYVFEIALMEADLAEMPGDARAHYYVGVDYVALGDKRSGEAANKAYREGLVHLRRRIEIEFRDRGSTYGGSTRDEMTYVALLMAAHALERLGDLAGAEEALGAAARYDGARAEAGARTAALLLASGRYADAVAVARGAAPPHP